MYSSLNPLCYYFRFETENIVQRVNVMDEIERGVCMRIISEGFRQLPCYFPSCFRLTRNYSLKAFNERIVSVYLPDHKSPVEFLCNCNEFSCLFFRLNNRFFDENS